MGEGAISEQEIANREHIAPSKTGDNIAGKKVANYSSGSDGSWARTPLPLVDRPFDTVDFSNPDGNDNYQTIQFLSNSSVTRTLTLAFDGTSNVTSITRT